MQDEGKHSSAGNSGSLASSSSSSSVIAAYRKAEFGMRMVHLGRQVQWGAGGLCDFVAL
jgi:hypothetical protein